MSETKYGPWKIWNGGKCPVDPDTRVQIQTATETRFYAEKSKNYSIAKAGGVRWSWDNVPNDIIAYREVIEPKRETVVRYARFYECPQNIGAATAELWSDATIRLHIPLVDGDLEDGAMIRVERL